MRFQRLIEMLEHDARLDQGGPRLDVDGKDLAQIFAAIEHDGAIDRLPALAGAAAPHQDRHAMRPRGRQRRLHIVACFRDDDSERFDLVDGGVRGVAPAIPAPE